MQNETRQADLFATGPNAATFADGGNRALEFSLFAQDPEFAAATPAERAMQFMHSLRVPEGPHAGNPVSLAPFQSSYIEGALAPEVSVAVLSIARGNGKSATTAGIALGGLLGVLDRQPRREIIVAARTRDQGRIIWDFVAGFARSLPLELQRRLIYRRAPRLEIEFEGDGGGHVLRVIPADGKSALGGAPTCAIMDERGNWELDRGNSVEHSPMTGLGKRGGRAFLLSTSAPDDTHPFSRWIDDPAPGTYVQEHRPAPGLPADDLESLVIANPGSIHGIGATPERLQRDAERAIAREGSALISFRNLNRNERISGESRDLLITHDQWLNCETVELPPRQGGCVVGIDLGGSASMSAAAFYWPETGRLECLGTFPSMPNLLDRGQADGVVGRYVEMQERGELTVMGEKTVPVAAWLTEVMRHVAGETVTFSGALAMLLDRLAGETWEESWKLLWQVSLDVSFSRAEISEVHQSDDGPVTLSHVFAAYWVTPADVPATRDMPYFGGLEFSSSVRSLTLFRIAKVVLAGDPDPMPQISEYFEQLHLEGDS